MSDRLKQLQHQRALLLEQLAWIDREIAAEAGPTPSAATPPAPVPTPAPAALPAAPPALADDIIAQYKTDPLSVKEDVKKGCFLYFFLASAVVGLGVIALYFYSTHR